MLTKPRYNDSISVTDSDEWDLTHGARKMLKQDLTL